MAEGVGTCMCVVWHCVKAWKKGWGQDGGISRALLSTGCQACPCVWACARHVRGIEIHAWMCRPRPGAATWDRGGRQTEQEAASPEEFKQALCYVTRMGMASLGQPLSPSLPLRLFLAVKTTVRVICRQVTSNLTWIKSSKCVILTVWWLSIIFSPKVVTILIYWNWVFPPF